MSNTHEYMYCEHDPEKWDTGISIRVLTGSCPHESEDDHLDICFVIHLIRVCWKCHCLYVEYEN